MAERGGVAQAASSERQANHATLTNGRRIGEGKGVESEAASFAETGETCMTGLRGLVVAGLYVPLFAASAAFAQAPAEGKGDARCEVWKRELGFARSVADHDAKAFADHVHVHAVFGVGGPRRTRGREAIVAEWKGIIDGSVLELRWYPDQVSLAPDGRTAHSSGPALYRDPKDGNARQGRFGSVWQRDDDGAWRVVFDGGVQPPKSVDAAAVQAFEAGRRYECPTEG